MNLYQTLKCFGKKVLLFSGFVAFLNGCGGDTHIEYKTSQFFEDLDNDNRLENIVIQEGDYTDSNHSVFYKHVGFDNYKEIDHRDYKILVSKKVSETKFDGTKEILTIHSEPKEVLFKDINDDGYLDLVYLIFKGHTNDSHSEFYRDVGFDNYKKISHTDYNLMIGKSKKDGTFEEPVISNTFHGRPKGIK